MIEIDCLTYSPPQISTPVGFEPDAEITSYVEEQAVAEGTSLVLTNDPRHAVEGSNCVVTDTWISMGQESQKQERLEAFQGYQVRHVHDSFCQV